MFTQDDLIDAIMEALRGTPSGLNLNLSPLGSDGKPKGLAERVRPEGGRPLGRQFLSEYDIRRRLTADALELRIPLGAIVSPLALDWLSLKGIRIVEE